MWGRLRRRGQAFLRHLFLALGKSSPAMLRVIPFRGCELHHSRADICVKEHSQMANCGAAQAAASAGDLHQTL
jgi:hypothetical protein